MIMILSLFRINLATFTHDYKRVVGTYDHDPLLVQDQQSHLYPRLQESGGYRYRYKRVVGVQMIMITSLFRINLATFTHDYKRVVSTYDHDPLLVQDQPSHIYPRLQEGGGYADDHDPLLVQDQLSNLYPRLQEGGGYR
jgi:hypothetical protein